MILQFLVIGVYFAAFVMAVYFLLVLSRIASAHERLATATEDLARKSGPRAE